MTGCIRGISGSTVWVEGLKGLRLFERVRVGNAELTGEVVRLEGERAVVQVYEETTGLGINEPVKGTGSPLTVMLGPGILGAVFDGLQRPLEQLRAEMGPFISGTKEVSALDYKRSWEFHPLKSEGDELREGDAIGYVEEGAFRHLILAGASGIISWIREGSFSLGEPLARLGSGEDVYGLQEWPVRSPRPYRRKLSPSVPMITGQRVIDFFFPIPRGGTAVIPGGFGTGKTILEQTIAKFADVDIVVYVGCGERGNEMAELLEEFQTIKDPWRERRLIDRTVLVVNTSNMPVSAREASIYTAVTIGEYYRDMGYNVLLLADSVSRWAEALREISSSMEEMPGEEGYPTYLASRIFGFYERAGIVETLNGDVGSLTMILSVSPPGGDFTEPVTQASLRTAGVFLMLDTSLAHRRHFPAINWSQSYSLYQKELKKNFSEKVSSEWEDLHDRCRGLLQSEEELREIAEIVGKEGLRDEDRLLMEAVERIRTEFLCQNAYTEDAFSSPEKTLKIIKEIIRFFDDASEQIRKGILYEDILKA